MASVTKVHHQLFTMSTIRDRVEVCKDFFQGLYAASRSKRAFFRFLIRLVTLTFAGLETGTTWLGAGTTTSSILSILGLLSDPSAAPASSLSLSALLRLSLARRATGSSFGLGAEERACRALWNFNVAKLPRNSNFIPAAIVTALRSTLTGHWVGGENCLGPRVRNDYMVVMHIWIGRGRR